MGDKLKNFLLVVMIILLLIAMGFLLYLLYQNIPGTPQSFTANIKPARLETENLSYKIQQFYPNMKFNHNSITYNLNLDCSDEKKERVTEALKELQEKTGVINFSLVQETNPDIEISCSKETKPLIEEDFFVAGEGGAKEIIKTGRYNIITNGIILLYDDTSGTRCEWPNIELHELLHVFGFGHSEDKNSLMYPYLESCEQKLDEDILAVLKELYSQRNAADLYFERAEAVKKGKFLDFNITIKNSGDADAENVILTAFDRDEKIEDFELGNLSFGVEVIFNVANLRLKSRGSDRVELAIDYNQAIDELDETNNAVEFIFE